MKILDLKKIKEGETPTNQFIIRNKDLSANAKVLYAIMKAIQSQNLSADNDELAYLLPAKKEEVLAAKEELREIGVLKAGVIID